MNQAEDAKKYQGKAAAMKLAMNMKDIVTEEKWDHTLVCSKRFCSGKFFVSLMIIPVFCSFLPK